LLALFLVLDRGKVIDSSDYYDVLQNGTSFAGTYCIHISGRPVDLERGICVSSMGYLTASNLRKRFAVSPSYHFARIIGEATKNCSPKRFAYWWSAAVCDKIHILTNK
jgi:hypothetical protein